MPETTETLSLGLDSNPMVAGFRKIGAESKRFASRFSTNMDSVSRRAKKAGTAMTIAFTAPIALMARSIWKATSQFEATQAKFSTVFGEMSDDIDAYIKEWKKITPVTRAEARGIASGIQDLLIPMGFAREEASGLTKDTLRLVGALANFNSDTRTATDVSGAFTAALTGMFRPLKALGINTSKLAVDQRAVAMGLAATTKEVTHQARAQALIAIATEQSQDALAAFNKESLDTKVRVSIAFKALNDSLISFSRIFLPLMDKFAKKLQGFAKSIEGMSESSRKALFITAAFLAALGPLALAIAAVSTVAGALAKTYVVLRAITLANVKAFALMTAQMALYVAAFTAGFLIGKQIRKLWSDDHILADRMSEARKETEKLNKEFSKFLKLTQVGDKGTMIIDAYIKKSEIARGLQEEIVNSFALDIKRATNQSLDGIHLAIKAFGKEGAAEFFRLSLLYSQELKKNRALRAGGLSVTDPSADAFVLGLRVQNEQLSQTLAALPMADVVRLLTRGAAGVDAGREKRILEAAALLGQADTGAAAGGGVSSIGGASAQNAALAVAGSVEAYRAETRRQKGDKTQKAVVDTEKNTKEANVLLGRIAKNLGISPTFNGVLGISNA